MERNNEHKILTCVLFPGIVKNENKALECLGGIRNISQVISSKTNRLDLSFHPDNPYYKKIYGDCHKAAGLLIKVKIKKNTANNQVKREVIGTTVVGKVNKIYKFESLCDYQYLPISNNGSEKKCNLDEIIPTKLDNFDSLKKQVPYFIVPASFLRSEKPISYSYTDKKHLKKSTAIEDTVHYRTREDRGTPSTKRFKFNLVDELPKEPMQYYLDQLHERMDEDYKIVKKAFEERPIWSYRSLTYSTKVKMAAIKVILPCLAIYMDNGPWCKLWVRYGYDPRKEPGAKMYQTLDFRLRSTAGVKSMVTPRKLRDSTADEDEVLEGSVIFRPGMAPTQRQIYYQYCDVKLPEVEALLSEADVCGSALCHEKRGWLPAGADDKCRDYIFMYAKRTLLPKNAEFKYEPASSGDEQNSDEEGDENSDLY